MYPTPRFLAFCFHVPSHSDWRRGGFWGIDSDANIMPPSKGHPNLGARIEIEFSSTVGYLRAVSIMYFASSISGAKWEPPPAMLPETRTEASTETHPVAA